MLELPVTVIRLMQSEDHSKVTVPELRHATNANSSLALMLLWLVQLD